MSGVAPVVRASGSATGVTAKAVSGATEWTGLQVLADTR